MLCQIGTYNQQLWPAEHWAEIQMDQADIHLNNMVMVETANLPGGPTDGGDGIHYSMDGYAALGIRLADVYMERWGK